MAKNKRNQVKKIEDSVLARYKRFHYDKVKVKKEYEPRLADLKKNLIDSYIKYTSYMVHLINAKQKKNTTLVIRYSLELQSALIEISHIHDQINNLEQRSISEITSEQQYLFTKIAIVIATASFISSAIFFCLEYFKKY